MSRWPLTIAALILSVSGVHAIERGWLPTFVLASLDGGSTNDGIARAGTRVVIYVPSDCVNCDGILKSLGSPELRALSSKIVVVVGFGDPQPVLESRTRHPQLQQAAWFADSTGAVGQWLGPGSTITLLGIRDGIVEWSVGGVLTDARDLTTIITSWIQQ